MDREPALVQQRVVMRAEQREVVEARVAAFGPMVDVMRVDVARAVAARERAAAIARPERALERRRDRALLSTYVERRAALVLYDRDQATVAGEPLDRLDRQIRSPNPSAEGLLVDVHDDLIVIGRGCARCTALRPSLPEIRELALRRDTPSRSRRAHRPAARASRPPSAPGSTRTRRRLPPPPPRPRSRARGRRARRPSGSSTVIRTTPRARSRKSVSERRSQARFAAFTVSGSTLRICRQRSSTWLAVASSAYASNRSSSCSAATRVSARTFEYDRRPPRTPPRSRASARRACAVRTFSRAADSDSPQLHASHSAQLA